MSNNSSANQTESANQVAAALPNGPASRIMALKKKSRVPFEEVFFTCGYLLAGGLWIVFSDRMLDHWSGEPVDTTALQTFKGLNFVITTALLYYLLLRRSFNRRRRAEAELQESNERFELAGRAATDAIWDWNVATGAVWWSDSFCKLFGYARAEVEPTTEAWLARIHPDDKERTLAAIKTAVESDRPMWAGEYRFRRKNGEYAHVQDRGYVIRDADGQAVRVVGGMTDVTEQRRAQLKLELSRRQLRALSARLTYLREEERGRLAREIHDELGQCLTAIKMDLRWIERKIEEQGEAAGLNPLLDKAVQAGAVADSAIASVQRISGELRPAALDSLGLTTTLRLEAEKFQERSNVICQLNIPEVLPGLSRDATTAIYRVFQETLTNVARHARASNVRIELREEGGQAILEIQDNGKGITLAALASPKSLGLLGMQERAEVLGGEVTVQPATGGGTVVRLRLPLSADDTKFWSGI